MWKNFQSTINTNFEKVHKNYSDMKRLQTSKGQRVQKFNVREKLQSQPLNLNFTYEGIVSPMNDFDGSQNQLQEEEPERPTKTAPSSEMQKIQRGKKNDTAIKGILQGIMSGEDKLPC